MVVAPADAGSTQEMAAPNKSRHWPSLHVLWGLVYTWFHTRQWQQYVLPLVVLTDLVAVVVIVEEAGEVAEGLMASGTNSPLITFPCTPSGQAIPNPLQK